MLRKHWLRLILSQTFMRFSPNLHSCGNSWHCSSVVALTHFLYIFHLNKFHMNKFYTEDSFWVKFKCCPFCCCCCKKHFKMGIFWSLWKDQRRGLTFALWISLHFLSSNCRTSTTWQLLLAVARAAPELSSWTTHPGTQQKRSSRLQVEPVRTCIFPGRFNL